jgi:Tfp pilus assembly protein PilF
MRSVNKSEVIMHCHARNRLIVSALGLAFVIGCHTLHMPKALDPSHDRSASETRPLRTTKAKDSSGLPPKEAAEACVATAQELQSKGYASEAIILYERARQLNPRQREVSRYLAVLYDQQGNDTRAQAEYNKALKIAPKDADLLNDFGYFHFKRRSWRQAETQFRAAIAQSPDHERAWINLGLTLGELERYQESFEAFAKILGEAEAHSNLGVILARHRKNQEALAAFHRALEIRPDLPQATAFLAYLERGQMATRPE